MESFLDDPEKNRSEINRIALSIQYNGTEYCGWQRQKGLVSVQEVIEGSIAQLDPFRPIKLCAAGRTDSGVHAAGQVAHFDCSGRMPAERWAPALNGRLPTSIRINESVLRPSHWHACYSAIYRRYRYTIFNAIRPNLFLEPWTWHRYQYLLDETLMRQALTGLIGCHDFSAFQRSGSMRADAITTIQAAYIERVGDLIFLDIQASGFLYGMVRLLIGQLVALGEHRLDLKTFEARWKERRRDEVKEAAPAKGLCLISAGYAEPIFSGSFCNDCLPRYALPFRDPPIDPRPNEESIH